AGDQMLDHPRLLSFYEAVAEEDIALAVHVGWACPSLSNMFTHIYPSSVNAFLLPVLMGYSAVISGGILDQFPKLRVAFLEAGCQWVHFMTERLEHRFKHSKGYLSTILTETVPKAKLSPTEYLKQGNLYSWPFSLCWRARSRARCAAARASASRPASRYASLSQIVRSDWPSLTITGRSTASSRRGIA